MSAPEAVSEASVGLVYLPDGGALGFVPLGTPYLVLVAAITAAYTAASEVAKRIFFARTAEPAGSRALR